MHRLVFRASEVWLLPAAPWAHTWFLPVVVGFLAAALMTALLIRIAPKRGWVSHPRQDRWNARVVAHFGGIPVLLGFSIAALFFFRTRQNLIVLLLTWGMAMLGLADDIAGLRPKAKLAGQTLLAGLAVYAGIVHPLTSHFWINVTFTMLWIVGITNAVNLLDNMDGLAAGIAIIAAAQVVLFAGPANPISGLALCMLAAVGAFLVFNVNPAKVFMGDVGALSMGFFLACASVKAAEHLSSLTSVLFVPCLVLFIPVFDTLLVSVTRRVSGRPISLGARDHASHRLVLIGLSERQAVCLLYVIAATAGVMAFLWKSSWGDLGAGIVSLFLIGSTLFWVYLAKLELPAAWVSPGDPRLISMPGYLQQAITGIFFFLLDAAVISLGLYFAYLVKFERLDRVLLGRFLFTAALVLAIKLPLLVVFAAHAHKWAITRRRDIYPVFKAVLLAACLLTAISAALPKTKAVESSIILFDSIFAGVLLVLCRASSRIFDDVFGKPSFLDLTMKKFANWSRLGSSSPRRDGTVNELALDETPAKEPEMEERPN
jgi:UDP-GlcNAc:undecaprenyl-phosphate/decaprenyl-phosphate GlcNAc-1-phosphate transferase